MASYWYWNQFYLLCAVFVACLVPTRATEYCSLAGSLNCSLDSVTCNTTGLIAKLPSLPDFPCIKNSTANLTKCCPEEPTTEEPTTTVWTSTEETTTESTTTPSTTTPSTTTESTTTPSTTTPSGGSGELTSTDMLSATMSSTGSASSSDGFHTADLLQSTHKTTTAEAPTTTVWTSTEETTTESTTTTPSTTTPPVSDHHLTTPSSTDGQITIPSSTDEQITIPSSTDGQITTSSSTDRQVTISSSTDSKHLNDTPGQTGVSPLPDTSTHMIGSSIPTATPMMNNTRNTTTTTAPPVPPPTDYGVPTWLIVLLIFVGLILCAAVVFCFLICKGVIPCDRICCCCRNLFRSSKVKDMDEVPIEEQAGNGNAAEKRPLSSLHSGQQVILTTHTPEHTIENESGRDRSISVGSQAGDTSQLITKVVRKGNTTKKRKKRGSKGVTELKTLNTRQPSYDIDSDEQETKS